MKGVNDGKFQSREGAAILGKDSAFILGGNMHWTPIFVPIQKSVGCGA